jgi:alkylation response protein AidB-like acyl-CoA dehydrogenase
MDVRLSAEQKALRESVAQVVDRLGPKTVNDLDNTERAAKLDAALDQAGLRELRTGDDGGAPFTTAVEPVIVAEALARGAADAPFIGPTLAVELRRIAAAAPASAPETVAFTGNLAAPALADGATVPAGAVAVDAAGAQTALVLVRVDGGYTLATAAVDAPASNPKATAGIDLTRPTVRLEGALTPVEGSTVITEDALTAWKAFGQALACAELVGLMDGALFLARDYATGRAQYGHAIGSFQAVQHLLADAYVLLEGSRSAALHAAWSVDAETPAEALTAGAIAKAYAARSAQQVIETSIQVHGGNGNTWEYLPHVYLRRSIVAGDLFGGVGASLDHVLSAFQIGA